MKTYGYENFTVSEVEEPSMETSGVSIPLTDKTMEQRLEKVQNQMKEIGLEALVVYGDLEHGSNFEYLTGFLTRFEEGILVLHRDRRAYLLLGNENTRMVQHSRIPAALIHVPFFSLPNQPMEGEQLVAEYFREAGLQRGQKVGVAGWKMFTSNCCENRKMYDLPGYLLDALREVVGEECLENHCDLFIGGKSGVRTVNNANEIAHYEYGASLAGARILEAQNYVVSGVTELELGNCLNAQGQKNSVVTIAAVGERFAFANFYPTEKAVRIGDKMSLTVGYKGGLSSRTGYAVENREQLPIEAKDYEEALLLPYFAAVTAWLENVRIGMEGRELYQLIEKVLPQKEYHWKLNPGHLTSDEEWLSSPIYLGSMETLKSGMLLQIDIIPEKSGYAGVSCESTIALADKMLRYEIQEEYPELYHRFQRRRDYLMQVLNIKLPPWVLPMSDTTAYYRPYFLNRKLAVLKKQHMD